MWLVLIIVHSVVAISMWELWQWSRRRATEATMRTKLSKAYPSAVKIIVEVTRGPNMRVDVEQPITLTGTRYFDDEDIVHGAN